MKSFARIALLYRVFALLVACVNLAAQIFVTWLSHNPGEIEASLLTGTFVDAIFRFVFVNKSSAQFGVA